MELDKWYTAVVTYDDTTVRLYINGIWNSSLGYKKDFVLSSAPIVIGGNPNTTGVTTKDYFKGTISEAAIMRTRLTGDEIAKNYGPTIHHDPTKHDVISYLKFDADHGIVSNGARYADDGMAFDGVDDLISVGYSSYDFQNSFTIGVRVKLNEDFINKGKNVEYSFFGNPQSAGFNLFKNTDNKFAISVFDENANNAQGGYISAVMPDTPMENVWYTVIATYDGKILKLYVNGELVSSNNNGGETINMKVCTTPFMIAVNANLTSKLTGGYLDGKISDAILIDEALTAEQIKTYYSNDLRTVVSDKTMISYDFRNYEKRPEGTVIPEEMINSMWVWIPRFKAVAPTNDVAIDLSLVEPNELSHDAFNFGGTELEGFWCGKFENGSAISTAGTSANAKLLIKPNCASIRNSKLSIMFDSVQSMLETSNMYGFVPTTGLQDTHVVKNNEWGAMAYLTYSKYGLWNTGTYQALTKNNSDYITGGTDYKINVNQSSTQNIYGIYDLYGGVNESTMGMYHTPTTDNSGFNPLPDSKYFITYTDEKTYKNNHLQHAMFETNILNTTEYALLVNAEEPWIVRAGLFGYTRNPGGKKDTRGTRTVLAIKKQPDV